MDAVYRNAALVCIVLAGVAAAAHFAMRSLQILTLGTQVGCLVVILSTLFAAIRHKGAVGRRVQDAVNNLPAEACPDLWVRKTATNTCGNSFVDSKGDYMYVIGGPSGQEQSTPVTKRPSVTLKTCAEWAKRPASAAYPFEYLQTLCRALKLETMKTRPRKLVCRPA